MAWWQQTVTGNRHSINRPENQDHGFLAVNKAEELSGINHQRVSRWRHRLENVEEYRKDICGAAWQEAMGDVAGTNWNQSASSEHWTPHRAQSSSLNLRRHHTLALTMTTDRVGDDGAARDFVVLDQGQAPLAMAARAGDQAAPCPYDFHFGGDLIGRVDFDDVDGPLLRNRVDCTLALPRMGTIQRSGSPDRAGMSPICGVR